MKYTPFARLRSAAVLLASQAAGIDASMTTE